MRQAGILLKVFLFAAIGVLLLWLIYRERDPRQMMADIAKADFRWIAASIFCGYLAIISRGLRWVLLLRPAGFNPSSIRAVHAVAVGYFANLGIPRSGELARCSVYSGTEGIAVDRLFGTVIIERLIDTMMLMLVGSIALILNWSSFTGFFTLAERARASVAESPEQDEPVFGLWWVILASVVIVAALLIVLRNKPWRQRIRAFASGVKAGLMSITKLRQPVLFIAHTFLIWFCYFLTAWLCFKAMPETVNVSLSAALFVMVAGGLGMVVPTPGGAGSYHAAVTLGFIALFASGEFVAESELEAGEAGAKFAAIVWTAQTLMMIIGGLVGLFFLARAGKTKMPNG